MAKMRRAGAMAPALGVRELVRAVDKLADRGRGGEGRAARAAFRGDDDRRRAAARVAIGGLPLPDRVGDVDLPLAEIVAGAGQGADVVEVDVQGGHPQGRDHRQRKDRDAEPVAEPGEVRSQEDKAAHHERHGGGARRDVGGKERPGDGSDEQGRDGDGVDNRQRQTDPCGHPPRQDLARPEEGEEDRADQDVEPGEKEDLPGRVPRGLERHGLRDDRMRLPQSDQDGGERHGGEQSRNPIHRPFQVPPDLRGRARIDLVAHAARVHPGVRAEDASRRIMDGKRPDEDQAGEEPQPVAPSLRALRQRAERHVGEQVARLGRQEEEERPGEDAKHADAAGDESSHDPKRVTTPAHDRSPRRLDAVWAKLCRFARQRESSRKARRS